MLEVIKRDVNTFLKSADAEVLVIRGKWGTGKTFAWNAWLKDAIQSNGVLLEKYSYVSLFGCQSLDELKAQIFEETLPLSFVGSTISAETIANNLNATFHKSNWKMPIHFLGSLSKMTNRLPIIRDFTVDAWRLGWLTTREQIICIDDIERIGEGLRLKDVFGLISVLKDQKKCKVVLILNDEANTGDNEADFKLIREKIVDSELYFNPDSIDLIRLVFSGNERCYETLENCILSLSLKNVRTLLKIKKSLEKLNDALVSVPDILYQDIINSIVVMVYLFYSPDPGMPTLDDLLDADVSQVSIASILERSEDDDAYKQEKLWADRINYLRRRYKWAGATDLDKFLGKFIQEGFFQSEELSHLLASSSQRVVQIQQSDQAQRMHSELGDLLYSGFNNNVSEIIAAMRSNLAASCELHPSLAHLNQYITILNELEESAAAEDLLQYYIDLCRNKSSKYFEWTSSQISFAGTIPQNVRDRISAEYIRLSGLEVGREISSSNLQTVFDQIFDKSRSYEIARADIQVLAQFTTNQLTGFLRSRHNSKEVLEFFDVFLKREPYLNGLRAEYQTIRQNLSLVLRSFAEESAINRYRLRDYLAFLDAQETDERDAEAV